MAKKKIVVDDEIIDNPEEVTIEQVVSTEKAELLALYAKLQELGITRISDLEGKIARL